MDWSQFQTEPEPATAPTLRDKFLAHLALVDRSLAELRAACRRGDQSWPANRLSATECFARLDGACSFVRSPSHVPAIKSDLGSSDELLSSLANAKDIASRAREGAELTPEMFRVLQSAHGLVKTVRRHLTEIAAAAKDRAAGIIVGETKIQFGRPALLVHPTSNLRPKEVHLDYPIGAVLWQLAMLTVEQRIELMRAIVEDEETKLLEMLIEPDCDPSTPSFFLLLSKNVELPDGTIKTVQLPFRSTFERRGTSGWKSLLRIAINTSTEAELTVRNTLLTEIPLTRDLSITLCETATTFRPARDPNHEGKTVISFTGDIELAFYGRLSSRIRDVSFRSIAASKSNVSMERANTRSTTKACDELKRMLASSTSATNLLLK